MLQLTELQLNLITTCAADTTGALGCTNTILLAQSNLALDDEKLAQAIDDTNAQALLLVEEGIFVNTSQLHEKALQGVANACQRDVCAYSLTQLGKEMFSGQPASTAALVN